MKNGPPSCDVLFTQCLRPPTCLTLSTGAEPISQVCYTPLIKLHKPNDGFSSQQLQNDGDILIPRIAQLHRRGNDLVTIPL